MRTPFAAIGESGGRVPRDLSIRGAGMDATLITVSSFFTQGTVWNLHLSDCTIDCANDPQAGIKHMWNFGYQWRGAAGRAGLHQPNGCLPCGL